MTFQYFASRTIRLAFVLAAMILAAGGCSSDDVATSPDAQGCANLAATRFTDTTVQQTQFVAAGADLQPITGSAGKAAAAFCRVVATVGSEPGEHVGIEVGCRPRTGTGACSARARADSAARSSMAA
ncbi:hypothetical protein [Burkholderia gladioli]|uniref:hypothetical protein n=1 Tax=Burkholderia gladioli TaxID=28095 RepID=UPI002FDF9617